jgi:AMP-polyphosphate phosphotransferase
MAKTKQEIAAAMPERFATEGDYLDALSAVERRLLCVQQAYLAQGRRAIIVFEGMDAAGKGGTIKRLTENLDPRVCKVWPISAPNAIESGQHWLARFFARLPTRGTIAVFDRSWYGRVLVERVEGLIPKKDWRRAYDEILAFERMLVDDGAVIVKLFLHIDKDEQAKRFLERLTDPLKRWKINGRDFEARGFFKDYEKAAEIMIRRTSTEQAAWTLVPATYKWVARITCLEKIADTLSQGVDLTPPPLAPELRRLAEASLGVAIHTKD